MTITPPAPLSRLPGFRPWETDRMSESEQLDRLARGAPRVAWDDFIRDHLNWKAGEHFSLIGPTGQGKTHMLLNLLPLRTYVTVCATKPEDDSMDRLIATGYAKIERWVSVPAEDMPRRVLWPNASRINARVNQKRVFEDALDKIFRERGWCVALDELWYMINVLGLGDEVRMYLLQGRSLGISLVAATQRPAFVPLEIYDQSTHLMFWRDNDERNLARISGISYHSSGLIRQIVSQLEHHQVLYINTRTGAMLRTRAPALPPIGRR